MLILLYSKYSKFSKDLLKVLPPEVDIKLLCLDNENIRKTFINDSCPIKYVPCLLVFDNDKLLQYNGYNDIVNFINTLIQQSQPPPPPPQQTQPPPPSIKSEMSGEYYPQSLQQNGVEKTETKYNIIGGVDPLDNDFSQFHGEPTGGEPVKSALSSKQTNLTQMAAQLAAERESIEQVENPPRGPPPPPIQTSGVTTLDF
jgi:hypothetical protein